MASVYNMIPKNKSNQPIRGQRFTSAPMGVGHGDRPDGYLRDHRGGINDFVPIPDSLEGNQLRAAAASALQPGGRVASQEILSLSTNLSLQNITNWNTSYILYPHEGANDSGGGGGPGVDDEGNASPPPHYHWPVLCLFCIVILTLCGNILVCLAVKSERKLQNMFNYFLVSLAMSDMLSAVLVMPLSIVKALMVELELPMIMCVTWYSLDVLFTSSAIIHLCMISVDRYMSLKFPLKYGHAKKTKPTILKLVLVWVISICIAGPLFLLSMFDKQSNVHYKGCGPESPTFVVSATVASFYLPLLIMTIMYALTVQALRQQLREQRRLAVTNSLSSREDSSTQQRIGHRGSPRASPRLSPAMGNGATREAFIGDAGKSPLITSKDLHDLQSTDLTGSSSANERTEMYPLTTKTADRRYLELPITPSSTCTDILALQDTETDTNSKDTAHHRRVTTVPVPAASHYSRKKFRVRTFRFRRNEPTTESGRRMINGPDRGRRAVQVLGILFAVFVLFYLPFFLAYIINGTCVECRLYISPQMIMGFEWLAYSGSFVNPIVYHIFNPDFRRAFQKILRCNCWKR